MGEVTVRVTPRSSSNRIETVEGKVKIWVTVPPADGQANDAATKLLAKALGVAPSSLRLIRGAASRDKTFHVDGLTSKEIETRLNLT